MRRSSSWGEGSLELEEFERGEKVRTLNRTRTNILPYTVLVSYWTLRALGNGTLLNQLTSRDR